MRVLLLHQRDGVPIMREGKRAWFITDSESPNCRVISIPISVWAFRPMTKRRLLFKTSVDSGDPSVPGWCHLAHESTDAVFLKQIEQFDFRTILLGVNADEEIDSAILRFLYMSLSLCVRFEIIRADVELRAIHAPHQRNGEHQ